MTEPARARHPAVGPFSYERAEDLLEYHLARTSRGARLIYLSVALLLVGALVALPLIRVDVYVRAPGIVRPTSEKHEVTIGIDGFVESSHLVEASSVEEGDVLLTIRARPTDVRIETLDADLRRTEGAIADLGRLLSVEGGWGEMAAGLVTGEYAQEARTLSAILAEVDVRISNERRELDLRELQLERELVPPVEVATQRFNLEYAQAQRALSLEGTRNRWAEQLAGLEEEARSLRSQRAQLAQAKAYHEVKSPTRGSLDEVLPISQGSFVRAGTRVAVVSPETELIGEVLVSPQDVGLVQPNSTVVLRIDAFNPHEWGVLTGTVRTISGDVVETSSGFLFRVRTSLDRDFLELASGHRGNLRKGMTFEARFMVARRTLFQLLRDKVDDWVLDPLDGPTS